MNTNTKYLIGVVAAVLIIAAIAAVGIFKGDTNQNSGGGENTAAVSEQNTNEQNKNTQSQNKPVKTPVEATQEPLVLPTFMYFVAPSDALYNDAVKVYEELSKEYEGKVRFELKDVDAEPELKERYMVNLPDSPVPMHTPTLIMLDVHNNISTIGLTECVDKETLKAAIEKALAA